MSPSPSSAASGWTKNPDARRNRRSTAYGRRVTASDVMACMRDTGDQQSTSGHIPSPDAYERTRRLVTCIAEDAIEEVHRGAQSKRLAEHMTPSQPLAMERFPTNDASRREIVGLVFEGFDADRQWRAPPATPAGLQSTERESSVDGLRATRSRHRQPHLRPLRCRSRRLGFDLSPNTSRTRRTPALDDRVERAVWLLNLSGHKGDINDRVDSAT